MVHKNKVDIDIRDSSPSKYYRTGGSYDLSKKFQKDLTQLRVIRILGISFPVKVKAREPDGTIVNFSGLMEKHPKSYNYHSPVILYFKGWEGSHAESFDIVESQAKISDIDFLIVGTANIISMDAMIEANIGLVKESGDYKYYSDEDSLFDVPLKITDNLKVSLPPNFLNDIEIVVDVQ